MTNYYSTQSFLSYCINRYFYNGVHYVYCAPEFFPYRRQNPKSSNPLLIYMDLYQPWKDHDNNDKFIAQHRQNLRKGIIAQRKLGAISDHTAKTLKQICDKVDITLLYPLVYRVDPAGIDPMRLVVSGSGLTGSSEYLIEDLKDSEFELLFFDHDSDPDIQQLRHGSVGDYKFAQITLRSRISP